MKTFNWGHAITLFYIVFVGALLTVLIKSFSIDRSLVVDDYYAKDLAFQSQYDKVKNTLDSDQLKMAYDNVNGNMIIEFKNESDASGIIQFYRPSNKSLDFEVVVSANEMRIPVQHLPVGKWRIKVDWTVNNEAYYKEEAFYF